MAVQLLQQTVTLTVQMQEKNIYMYEKSTEITKLLSNLETSQRSNKNKITVCQARQVFTIFCKHFIH